LLASRATITVRGLGADELAALKRAAEREGISMNRLALRRLVDQSPAAAIAPLQQVDPDLWG
jgi:hypothetical protein